MENNTEVVYLYLDDIIPNRFQPREVFDEQALKELAVSIKEHGVIQPIIVRKVDNKYEIIAGERRYKASTMAGLNKIPAIIKNYDDKESSKVALIENVQRRDLSPIEEARTFQKILELEEDMTQEQLAATMGKTQSSVSNKLRLLALPDEIQDALLNEKISERHARCLLTVDDANEQVKLLNRIIEEKLTVRELDKIVKEMKEGPSASSSGVEEKEGPETADDEKPSEQSVDKPEPTIKGFETDNDSAKEEEVKEEPVKEEQPQNTEVAESEQKNDEDNKEPADAPVNEAAPVQPEETKEEPKEEEKKEERKAPTFNFDFSKLSNPFLKKSEQPEPSASSQSADSNVASVKEDIPAVSEPVTKEGLDFSAVKTDLDEFVKSLVEKGYTCKYTELNNDNKLEYTITIEK
jgi:ParB family chromosome partitioning protein